MTKYTEWEKHVDQDILRYEQLTHEFIIYATDWQLKYDDICKVLFENCEVKLETVIHKGITHEILIYPGIYEYKQACYDLEIPVQPFLEQVSSAVCTDKYLRNCNLDTWLYEKRISEIMNQDEMVDKLSEMYDGVESEYQRGEISWEEKESRQQEIMQTWRTIQP